MAIRDSSEMGENLMRIASKLCENQRLLRLLRYSDTEPFSPEHEDLLPQDILHKNIRVVPLVNEKEDNTESTVVLIFKEGEVQDNSEFKTIYFDVLVYTPLHEWTLNDINLRPFLLMSEIEKSLKNKRVESLGTINYGGFELELVTDILSCYRLNFKIDVFN